MTFQRGAIEAGANTAAAAADAAAAVAAAAAAAVALLLIMLLLQQQVVAMYSVELVLGCITIAKIASSLNDSDNDDWYDDDLCNPACV